MSVLARVGRDLVQYGFTPDRIAFTLSGRDAPRVVANSFPKAGTNLLLRCLYLMYPLRRRLMRTLRSTDLSELMAPLERLSKGQIAAAHLTYSTELAQTFVRLGLRHVLMMRDPRDVAVSDYHYKTYQDRTHPLHGYYANGLKSDDERLLASIRGFTRDDRQHRRAMPTLAARLQTFLDWNQDKACLLVRFEDLVGDAGGGDDERQLDALRRIDEHLGLAQSEADLRRVAAKVYSSGSRTFRRGQAGTWRDHWTAAHDDAALRTGLPAVIEALGYPPT
jgi:hypothetical protein